MNQNELAMKSIYKIHQDKQVKKPFKPLICEKCGKAKPVIRFSPSKGLFVCDACYFEGKGVEWRYEIKDGTKVGGVYIKNYLCRFLW